MSEHVEIRFDDLEKFGLRALADGVIADLAHHAPARVAAARGLRVDGAAVMLPGWVARSTAGEAPRHYYAASPRVAALRHFEWLNPDIPILVWVWRIALSVAAGAPYVRLVKKKIYYFLGRSLVEGPVTRPTMGREERRKK
jgi:hypothetical protein